MAEGVGCAGNLTFAGGKTRLADDINVNSGRGMVTNDGVLRLATPQTISGNFSQTPSSKLALSAIDGFGLTGGDVFDLMTLSPDGASFSGVSLNGAPVRRHCRSSGTAVRRVSISASSLGRAGWAQILGVSEPSIWALMAMGFLSLAGLGWWAGRKPLRV